MAFVFARKLGFVEPLGGAATTELAGVVPMMFALDPCLSPVPSKVPAGHAARLMTSGVVLPDRSNKEVELT